VVERFEHVGGVGLEPEQLAGALVVDGDADAVVLRAQSRRTSMPSFLRWSSSRIAVWIGALAVKILGVVMALGSFRYSACSFVTAFVEASAATKTERRISSHDVIACDASKRTSGVQGCWRDRADSRPCCRTRRLLSLRMR
jgi:hypothetical protein